MKAQIFIIKLLLAILTSINLLHAQNGPNADEYIRLANDLRKSMKPDSAILYYEMAAAEFQATGNTEKWIDAYNQIGVVLTRQDKYPEAKSFLEKAMVERYALADTNNLVVATTYISLGVVYSAEGDYSQSLIYHFKALSIRLEKLGENDAQVATSYGNIGNVYRYNGELDKSIEAHTKAMNIRESIFGEESPEIVESYAGLGNAYREKKDYAKSLMCFEKALNNKILQRGKGHADLVKYYNYISEVYYLMGNKEQGDSYKAEAEAIGNRQ
jgi:tetratricopeptide (TPR) repeat protein